MANRRFLTAAATFISDLFMGRDRKAIATLQRKVGDAAAARLVKELTGKRTGQKAEEVRSAPQETKAKPGPGEDGDVILVDSSNVHSFGYWNATRILQVRFLADAGNGQRSGPGPMYDYYNVPKSVFEKLKDAASKGGAVWDMLRVRGSISAHQYDYALSGAGAGGYVPRKETGVGRNPREIKQGGKTYKSNKPGTGRFKK